MTSPIQVQEGLICLLLLPQVGKRLNVRRERRHVLDVQRAAAAEALRREEEQFDHIKHEFELDSAGIRSAWCSHHVRLRLRRAAACRKSPNI